MTRLDQIALYTKAFRASAKLDRQRGAAKLACMMDRGTRYEDFEALLGRLSAQADDAWANARAATTDRDIIIEVAKGG